MSMKVAQNGATRKMKDFDKFTKKYLTCGQNFGKIIVATSFEKLPKVQYIAKSVHTVRR